MEYVFGLPRGKRGMRVWMIPIIVLVFARNYGFVWKGAGYGGRGVLQCQIVNKIYYVYGIGLVGLVLT
jgi:hypothetical protein